MTEETGPESRPTARGRIPGGVLRRWRERKSGVTEDASTHGGTPAERPMLALSSRFGSMQAFYRFRFLPDGYPGRAEPDGSVFPHPIYGTYVLKDYLGQFDAHPSEELAEAIRTVAEASISRMERFHGALVFWYDPQPTQAARLYEKHYSGLTQGYYAVELHRAGVALGDQRLIAAARSAFDSLLIPAESGGVFYQSALGCTIAEVPQRPNSWILNGWMSSLTSIYRYAELSGSEEARDVFLSSAQTMARMLHLYDDPVLRISRYGLTGFTYLRLIFETRPKALKDVRLTIPGEGAYLVPAVVGTRWQPFVFEDDLDRARPKGRTVRMNMVVSLASAPEPNRVSAAITTAVGGQVRLEGMCGEYDPLTSNPVRTEWVELGAAALSPGRQDVCFDLPVEFVEAATYPTNFVKKVDGHNVNIYHGVHVSRLREIGRLAGIDLMFEWADRWAAYVSEWPSMPIYDGLAMRDFTTGKVRPLKPSVDG